MTEELILCTMDIRRSPTQSPFIHRTNEVSDLTKTVSMKIYTGDLWAQNPNAHIYIMVDGYIDSSVPERSLQGRGIGIGHTPAGVGIVFEHFGEDEFIVGHFEKVCFLSNEFYDIKISCNKQEVWWQVNGPGLNLAWANKFSKEYPSFDTVIGVAGDKNSSTYGFFNVIQRIGE